MSDHRGDEIRTDDREVLKAVLRKNSLEFGEFVLSSGQKSDYYIDARRTTLDPEGARRIGRILHRRIRELGLEPDAIGGLTMGADPIAFAVAAESLGSGAPIQAIVVRKAAKGHGTKRRIEGNFRPGDRVVVVEDVGSTGASALSAIRAVREAGGEVVHVFVLVDRMMGAMEAIEAEDVTVEAVFRIDEFLADRRG
jgi:orotate phosphoribosyltransferase